MLKLAQFLDGDVSDTKHAEAGWRSTIAAIDFLQRAQTSFGHTRSEHELINEILTAWEGIV